MFSLWFVLGLSLYPTVADKQAKNLCCSLETGLEDFKIWVLPGSCCSQCKLVDYHRSWAQHKLDGCWAIYIYTIYGQFTCSTNYLVRFPDPLVKTKLGNLLHTSLYGLLTATGWKTRWIGRAVRPIWCSCDITQNFLVVCCLAKRKSGRWDSVFSDKWEHGQLFLILMHIRKYDHIEVCREVIYGSRMVPNTARLVRLRAVPQGDWRYGFSTSERRAGVHYCEGAAVWGEIGFPLFWGKAGFGDVGTGPYGGRNLNGFITVELRTRMRTWIRE